MNFKKLLSLSPWIEVVVRNFYWRFRFIRKQITKVEKKKLAKQSKNYKINHLDVKTDFQKMLNQSKIVHGDILIVHSSSQAIEALGFTPQELCEFLIDYLGQMGTLAMPAFPLYKEEPKELDLDDSIITKRLVYNVERTPVWTGILPRTLLKFEGAIRSKHPINSMVAIGAQAEAMMQNNIAGDMPLPCGINSSWKYCADKNAKILFLGVDVAHSITMIHVVEDSWEVDWPVKNWYRDRMFKIIDKGFELDLTVRERRPKWAMYYAERTLQKKLVSEKVLDIKELHGVSIGLLESNSLVQYLRSERPKAFPYYFFGINYLK
jgi:aminoglycoside 3-N-acetyltransferase